MPLETGTYIPDLVASNPAHTDGLNQGDGHLRLIKSTLQNTFPHFTDVALNSTQAQLDAAVNLLTGASGAAAFPAGTAAAPSIAFVGDPDSGFYKIAEDSIGLAINGTSVGVLNANSGGVGLVPAGSIVMFQGGTVPTGWAWMNGQAISGLPGGAAGNPTLAAIYGSNLADWRCYVPGGVDNMGGAGTTGAIAGFTGQGTKVGETNHTLTTTQCPTGLLTLNFSDPGHSHGITDPGHTHTVEAGGSGISVPTGFFLQGSSDAGGWPNAAQSTTTGITIQSGGTNISASLSDHGGNGAHNNVQLTVATGFIIKLG